MQTLTLADSGASHQEKCAAAAGRKMLGVPAKPMISVVVQERVIGQADAVSAVARAMKRARSGLKDPRRPIAAMLFAGPTGVGKTELTKVALSLPRSHPAALWDCLVLLSVRCGASQAGKLYGSI